MSTTKLPEAFERKGFDDAPVQHDNSHSYVWADGYNSALEATGSKELWEANNNAAELLAMVGASDSFARLPETVQQWITKAHSVLSKSNPSNTVG